MAFKSFTSFATKLASSLGLKSGSQSEEATERENAGEAQNSTAGPKILVTYFSHTGDVYIVGKITEGNTAVIAQMIAKETGGTLFEIKPVRKYSENYATCVDEVLKEKREDARPAVVDDIAIEDYDVIFIGFPNWGGDCPMAVYTFIEKHNWEGKTVVPFCTHEGGGMSGTDRKLASVCKGSTFLKGFELNGKTAQFERGKALLAVKRWLSEIEL